MAQDFIKPNIFCSKCITFEYCRWNAAIIASEKVDLLKKYGNFIPHCPEVEIGLGIPRESARIVIINEKPRLIQPKSKQDHTNEMITYANDLISALKNIDGFILKAKSPSCGLSNIHYFKGLDNPAVHSTGSGIFAGILQKNFPYHPISDEGRLTNERAWEHFLTQIFTIAEFRHIKKENNIKNLIKFHSHHKFILMAYNQTKMREMGKLIGSFDKNNFVQIINQYEDMLLNALSKIPTYKSHINVLQHALGYFKTQLSTNEKNFILKEIENYRRGLIPLSVCIHLVKGLIIRFNQTYLEQQRYFEPYPEELIHTAHFYSTKEKQERYYSRKRG